MLLYRLKILNLWVIIWSIIEYISIQMFREMQSNVSFWQKEMKTFIQQMKLLHFILKM